MPAAKAGISEVGSGFDPAPTDLHAIRKYGHIVTGSFAPVPAKHTKHLMRSRGYREKTNLALELKYSDS